MTYHLHQQPANRSASSKRKTAQGVSTNARKTKVTLKRPPWEKPKGREAGK